MSSKQSISGHFTVNRNITWKLKFSELEKLSLSNEDSIVHVSGRVNIIWPFTNSSRDFSFELQTAVVRKLIVATIVLDSYCFEIDDTIQVKIWIDDVNNPAQPHFVNNFNESDVKIIERSRKLSLKLPICDISDLQNDKLKFVGPDGDLLTLQCKIDFTIKQNRFVINFPETVKELQQDRFNYFGSLLNNQFLSDVVLSVGEESFYAHKIVLSAYSEYFQKMFSGDVKEKNEATVKIEDDPKIFLELLKFIYTFDSSKFNMELALDLIDMAHKYMVDKLVTVCVEFFLNNLSIENCIDILLKIEEFHLKGSVEEVIDYICDNIKTISTDQSWKTLEEKNPQLGMRIATRAATSN